jgi:hypothetical protein
MDAPHRLGRPARALALTVATPPEAANRCSSVFSARGAPPRHERFLEHSSAEHHRHRHWGSRCGPRCKAPSAMQAPGKRRRRGVPRLLLPTRLTRAKMVRMQIHAGVGGTRVLPNPSLNRTRYGRQRKPGPRHMVHHLVPGLRRLPPRAG